VDGELIESQTRQTHTPRQERRAFARDFFAAFLPVVFLAAFLALAAAFLPGPPASCCSISGRISDQLNGSPLSLNA
jgi:hypothetical protein